jgi:hypothetical protein
MRRQLGWALKGYNGAGTESINMNGGRHLVTSMESIDDDADYKENGDPHDEVIRLEGVIEELTAKIESCRKFILASRIATWGGGVVLFAILFGVMRFDLGIMASAVAALLGGIVLWGSNSSTAKEAMKELAVAEADRAALVEVIDPRAIPAKAQGA